MPKSSNNLQKSPPVILEGNRLYSQIFDEHYAGKGCPEKEKLEVFCGGNNLKSRFTKADNFTVAELGFGAAISFLSCSALWLETSHQDSTLHFISFEKYPLTKEQLQHALKAYPTFSTLVSELCEQYPVTNRGFHRLHLFNHRVTLTLVFEDALEGLQQLDTASSKRIDAWFLDGFSPAKNSEMWQQSLFKLMVRHSKSGSTLATYTAAGQVRRDLESAGFTINKIAGYGGKRERLIGELNSLPRTRNAQAPWLKRSSPHESRTVTIVGAGISGCALANRFASRGFKVTLTEKSSAIAASTSSNPSAIVHPSFTVDNDSIAQLSQQGFVYSIQTMKRLNKLSLNSGFHSSGIVMRPKDAADLKRQQKIAEEQSQQDDFAQWKTSKELCEITGANIETEGWYFPQGGWVEIPVLCRALLDEFPSNISVKNNIDVRDIRYNDENGLWNLIDEQGQKQHQSEQIVLTQGCGLLELPRYEFPIVPNSGQASLFHVDEHVLKVPVCGQGYVIPISSDELFVGATHRFDSSDISTNETEQEQLEQTLTHTFQANNQPTNIKIIKNWTGSRTTLPDRLPLIGDIHNKTLFETYFKDMVLGKVSRNTATPSSAYGNLYVMTGLGSRGIAYSLICAETLASELAGEPSPLPMKLRNSLDSSRFLVRQIKREHSKTS